MAPGGGVGWPAHQGVQGGSIGRVGGSRVGLALAPASSSDNSSNCDSKRESEWERYSKLERVSESEIVKVKTRQFIFVFIHLHSTWNSFLLTLQAFRMLWTFVEHSAYLYMQQMLTNAYQ